MNRRRFAQYCFSGSYREVGRQYGEALRPEFQKWLDIQYQQLSEQFGASAETVRMKARSFFPVSERFAPGLVEQLRGMAEGANMTAEDAMLFQVFGEISNEMKLQRQECTSFSISSDYTADGKHYSGQNCDMYPAYADKCSVVTFAVTGKPRITFLLPIGYLSYNGMNSEGISCNHNALFGSPWKHGLPRFFVTRIGMECRTMDEVRSAIAPIDYIASRLTLFADRFGNTLCYEFDSQDTGIMEQKDGIFVHANNYLCEHMLLLQNTTEDNVTNADIRRNRLLELLEAAKGRITPEAIQTMLRDHENGRNSLCVHDRNGLTTFASIINCLDDGKLLIAKGSPCENEYEMYPV